MDAGLSDNYGVKNSIKFLYTFKDWIKENTSGIILFKSGILKNNLKQKLHQQKVSSKISLLLCSQFTKIYFLCKIMTMTN